jgi:hypothetical protein
LLGDAILLTFLGDAQRLHENFWMRKNIVVDGLLQCLVGDRRFAGVYRLRQCRDAAGERECASNREKDKQLLNVHTGHSSITQNGPAVETRQPYFIVAEIWP